MIDRAFRPRRLNGNPVFIYHEIADEDEYQGSAAREAILAHQSAIARTIEPPSSDRKSVV